MRRPPWLTHANGARALAGMTVVIKNPGSAAPAYEKLLGADRVARHETGFSARLGGAVVHFGVPGAGLASLSVTVADVEKTARCLDAAEIPYHAPGRWKPSRASRVRHRRRAGVRTSVTDPWYYPRASARKSKVLLRASAALLAS